MTEFPKLALMKLIRKSSCRTPRNLESLIRKLCDHRDKNASTMETHPVINKLQQMETSQEISEEQAMALLWHSHKHAPFSPLLVDRAASDVGIDLTASLLEPSTALVAPRSAGPGSDRTRRQHRRRNSGQPKAGSPMALVSSITDAFKQFSSKPVKPGHRRRGGSIPNVVAAAQTAVEGVMRRLTVDDNVSPSHESELTSNTDVHESSELTSSELGDEASPFLGDSECSYFMQPLYPWVARQHERGFGRLNLQILRSSLDSPVAGVATMQIRVGEHRKVPFQPAPSASCNRGQHILNKWSNDTSALALHSPDAQVHFKVQVVADHGDSEPKVVMRACVAVRHLLHSTRDCWCELWLTEDGTLSKRRPIAQAIQFRAQVQFSKTGEFFAHFLRESAPLAPKPRWTLQTSQTNMDHFLVYGRPVAWFCSRVAHIFKWTHPAHTMIAVAVWLLICWWPLTAAIIVHLAVLSLVFRNYINNKLMKQPASPAQIKDSRSEAFKWASLAIEAVTHVAPMPEDMSESLREFQNDLGELADDLEELYSLFDWSVEHDTEITTVVTVLSLCIHIAWPPVYVMLVIGAAAFLRYTRVYFALRAFLKGVKSFRRSSWRWRLQESTKTPTEQSAVVPERGWFNKGARGTAGD